MATKPTSAPILQPLVVTTPAPWWPLLLLLLSMPVTIWGVWTMLPSMDKPVIYGWTVWVVALFCYAHRMVYFYYLKKARAWVYVMAVPCVLLLYPVLFVCLLFVAALEQGGR